MIKLNHAIIGSVLPMFLMTMYFSNMIDDVWIENIRLQEKVTYMESILNIEQYNVIATIYNPVRGQTDKTPHITADGTRLDTRNASKYRYVALSRDLLKRWGGPFDYGDFVLLKNAGHKDGVYQVRDTMNPKWVNVVDILESKDVRPYKFTNAHIFKLPWVDTERG